MSNQATAPISRENLLYASALASANFALACLEPNRSGLRTRSGFVNPRAEAMHWHDFGDLEGPGWAANAIGGGHLLHQLGRWSGQERFIAAGLGLVDHILLDGFIDPESGFIHPYFDLARGELCLNYRHGLDWFCPGSLARIGTQLLDFSSDLSAGERSRAMRSAAEELGLWMETHLALLPGGWVPRRAAPDGGLFPHNRFGDEDILYAGSADGLFLLELWALLPSRRQSARGLAEAYLRQGGIWGSINHDTYDWHENTAYSCAFRILRRAAVCLEMPELAAFAWDYALPGLDRFRMLEDRNGVATRNLLWMEESWDTAYLWENAEAAWAYLEAGTERCDPTLTQRGVEILEAMALFHSGEMGFLTEGVDWNNHVGQQHHIDGRRYGAIQYTEPLLNNLHLLGPTMYFLERCGYAPPAWLDETSAVGLVTTLVDTTRGEREA